MIANGLRERSALLKATAILLLTAFFLLQCQIATAQGGEIIDATEAMRRADEEYIPGTARFLAATGDEKAETWAASTAGKPLLQNAYDPDTAQIVVLNWVVPAYADDRLVGLIGIDPWTGAYSWRIDDLPTDYAFPTAPGLETLRSAVDKAPGGRPWEEYNPAALVFALVDKHNYWSLPTRDGHTDGFLLLPVEGGEPRTLGQLRRASSAREAGLRDHGEALGRATEADMPPADWLPVAAAAAPLGAAENWWGSTVPLYTQQNQWCCNYCLSMVHQWFSPISLGGDDAQALAIANYLGHGPSDGCSGGDELDVMRHWQSIDARYENWPNAREVNFNPIAVGAPGADNDAKYWLSRGIPIIAYICAQGTACTANHDVVMVGYSDSDFGGQGGVYINDPAQWLGWPSQQPQESYSTFNNDHWRWSGTNACGSLGANECGAVGYPGDRVWIDVTVSVSGVDSPIYDDEEDSFTISWQIQNDADATPFSSFNLYTTSGVHLRTVPSSGTGGKGTLYVNSIGSFDSWTGLQGRNAQQVCSSSTHGFCEAQIFELETANDPSGSTRSVNVTFRPGDELGTHLIYYRAWAFDQDDRLQCRSGVSCNDLRYDRNPNNPIAVCDYRNNGATNCNFQMPAPTRWVDRDPLGIPQDNYLDFSTIPVAVNVLDDDMSGPTYSSLSSTGNIQDSYSGSYRVQANWTDPSGMYSVQFRYRFGSGSWAGWTSPSGSSGSTYWYDIPRSTWINYVGQIVYWESTATDNDVDRTNDRATATIPTQTGGSISDDDTSGPTYSNLSSTGSIQDSYSGNYRVQANWTDTSNIYLVEFRYRFGSGSWSSWLPASGPSGSTYWYDIPKTTWINYVGETVYWESRATDNDNDGWSNDRAITTIPTQTGGLISDDDSSGPSFTGFWDSDNASLGTYYFKFTATDTSLIWDDSTHPTIYYRWNNSTIDQSQNDGQVDAGWDGAWYAGSISVGSQRCGQTVYWRVLAYDDDVDQGPGDRSSTWSEVQTGGTIQCPNPPTLSWTGEVNYTSDGLHPESGGTGDNYIYRIKYSDADGDAPNYVRVHIKKGGTDIAGSPFTLSYASGSYSTGAIYSYTKAGLAAGTDYTYYFEAQDNQGNPATPTTELDAPDVSSPNNPPILSWTGEPNYASDGLHPESGGTGDNYIYRIEYTDADGDAPSYVRVHIKKGGTDIAGSPFTLSYTSGSYSTGAIYSYTKTGLAAGTDYTYYFEAQDNQGNPATPTTELDAPDVSGSNDPPTLSWTGEVNYTSDGLHPESGGTGDNYVYRIEYTDADGDAPSYVRVHIKKGGTDIAGSPFTLSYASGSYSTGAIYSYTKAGLAAGTDYTYYFEAQDNQGNPATSTTELDAPDVSGANDPPTLSWTGQVNYASDGLHPESGGTSDNYVYRIKYADADGDAPSYVRVHIKKGGADIAGSPFTMSCPSGDYTAGVICSYTKAGLVAGTDYTYYLVAEDSQGNPATPTTELNAPDVSGGPPPPILLVDDDDNSPDVRSYYASALDSLGVTYDVWDTGNSDSEPDATTLRLYTTVIWFTGDEFDGFAGPGAAGETALASFLDDGNCLFISSQDYHYDRGLTSFMTQYLGVASAGDDVGQTSVTGVGSVFGGLGPYSLSYPFYNYSDQISPDGTAELGFSGDQGDAAVNKDGGTYRTTFWGFPFEALPTETNRLDTMSAFLDWCGPSVPSTTVIVNEVDLGDPDAAEFFNAGGSPADMTGWLFTAIRTGNVTAYTFPAFTLAPGAYLVLHETSGTNSPTDLYMGKNIVWMNEYDGSASLTDSGGQGVDFVRWGASTDAPPAGTSWTGGNPASPSYGDNLGRDESSSDTDDGLDWCSQVPSLGAENVGCGCLLYLPLVLRNHL